MGHYVIAVGGTGNKILESIVYAACADAFYTVDEKGVRVPLSRLGLLSVDVDAACGNTTRAKRAAEAYEAVRQSLVRSPWERPCFHTEVALDRWSLNLSRRAASVEQMAQGHSQDQLLARTLFSRTEMELEYSEGFRGHPDLGVLFFADLLGTLDEARAGGQPDELNALIDQMEADIAHGEDVHLILCGSIFGGTGASGIPALSKYLHRRFAGSLSHFIMGAMLMMPYYKVPPAQVDERVEIAVHSEDFLDKARTALQYYGMEGMIRDGETDEHGLFDAVYLLGLPPEQFVSTRIYSTGSQSQENDAHILEWLASRCVAQFMRTGFRGADAHNIDCYYYQWHSAQLSWASFDADSAHYQARYGALLKAAAVFLTECHPTLERWIRYGDRRAARVSYCAAFFHGLRRFNASRRAELEGHVDALAQFLGFFVHWIQQVINSLPPIMQPASLADSALLDTLAQSADGDQSGSISIQKGLAQLVHSNVPDRRDMTWVIRSLGSGGSAREPDLAFASFLTALLSAVYEA